MTRERPFLISIVWLIFSAWVSLTCPIGCCVAIHRVVLGGKRDKINGPPRTDRYPSASLTAARRASSKIVIMVYLQGPSRTLEDV